MARINNTEVYPLVLNSENGMFLGTDAQGRTVNFPTNTNNGNSGFVIIDNVYVLTNGKIDLENFEVNDKFMVWDGDYKIEGIITSLPFDINNRETYKRAVKSKAI